MYLHSISQKLKRAQDVADEVSVRPGIERLIDKV